MFKQILTLLVLLALVPVMAQGNGIAGVWRSNFTDPNFGPGMAELVLQANGRFSQLTYYQAGAQSRRYASDAQVYIAGIYRFPAQGVLRLDIHQAEPREYCGPLGCNPIRYPEGETHYFRLADRNTLVLQLVACQQGLCQFVYRRVQ